MRRRSHLCTSEIVVSLCATTEIARTRGAKGFLENKEASHKGGEIAGDAREKLELEIGRKVVRADNYLSQRMKLRRVH